MSSTLQTKNEIWAISNIPFDNFGKYAQCLYVLGDIRYIRSGFNYKGYNYGLEIEFTADDITISNDKMNIFPLYYYNNRGRWIISNNIWEIVKADRPALNEGWFKRCSFYYNTPREGETFLSDVSRIRLGESLRIGFNGSFKKINSPALFSNSIQTTINSKRDLLEAIGKSLDDYFEFAKGLNLPKGYVGNSGGFDSRLMRYYLNRHNINTNPFTVVRKKSFLSSTTELAAKRVDNLYGAGRYYIVEKESERGLLMDILWNPLGTAEGGKVPKELLEEIRINQERPVAFCGGNGFLIGYNRTVWDDLLVKKGDEFVHDFLRGFAFGNIYSFSDSRLNSYGREIYREDLDILFTENEDIRTQGLQAVRHFQGKYLNIHSSTGGYESLIYQAFPMYMYYPSLIEVIQKTNDQLLLDRGLLESLLISVDPRLKFRGQDGKRPLVNKNLMDTLWAKVRSSGINNIANHGFLNKFEYKNDEFIRELVPLFPVVDSLDTQQKLLKFDRIISFYNDLL